MKPKINIIMAVRNGMPYIREAVNSVLRQTCRDFEFLILDDGSDDGTFKTLKEFKDSRIKIFYHPKSLGLTVSLNELLKKSKGKYIARMDADDVSRPKRLEKQMEFLEKNPKVVLCGTWVNLIDEKGKKIGGRKYPVSYREIKRAVMRYNPLVHPTWMVRKAVLDKVGFYDEVLDGVGGDYDLLLRIAGKYQVVNLPEILLDYRLNTKGVSFIGLKKLEAMALRARLKAIVKYNYPKWMVIFLIKPFISYLIPKNIKLFLIKKFKIW